MQTWQVIFIKYRYPDKYVLRAAFAAQSLSVIQQSIFAAGQAYRRSAQLLLISDVTISCEVK